jgi:hypothetical protein
MGHVDGGQLAGVRMSHQNEDGGYGAGGPRCRRIRTADGRGRPLGRPLEASVGALSFICLSRSGVQRSYHSFDKDRKCIFCDRVKSRRTEAEKRRETRESEAKWRRFIRGGR